MSAWQSFGFQSEYISFLINYFVHRARASGFIFWCALALFERSVILSSSLINNVHSHFFWYKIILAPLSHLYQPRLSLSFFSSTQMKLQPAGTQIHLYSDAITAPFPIVLGRLEKWFLIFKFIAWNYTTPLCHARGLAKKCNRRTCAGPVRELIQAAGCFANGRLFMPIILFDLHRIAFQAE